MIKREERLDDIQRLLVDVLVLVGLERLHPFQTTALLHNQGHLLSLPELLGSGEDVGHPIQHHDENIFILDSQEVAEWFQNSLKYGKND